MFKKKSLCFVLCLAFLLSGCSNGTTQSSTTETPDSVPQVTEEESSVATTVEQVIINPPAEVWEGSAFEDPKLQEKFDNLVTRVTTNLRDHGITVLDDSEEPIEEEPIEESSSLESEEDEVVESAPEEDEGEKPITVEQSYELLMEALQDKEIMGDYEKYEEWLETFGDQFEDDASDEEIVKAASESFLMGSSIWLPATYSLAACSWLASTQRNIIASGIYSMAVLNASVSEPTLSNSLVLLRCGITDDYVQSAVSLKNWEMLPGFSSEDLSQLFSSKAEEWGVPDVGITKVFYGQGSVVLPYIYKEEIRQVPYVSANGKTKYKDVTVDVTDHYNSAFTYVEDTCFTGTFHMSNAAEMAIYYTLSKLTLGMSTEDTELIAFLTAHMSEIWDKVEELTAEPEEPEESAGSSDEADGSEQPETPVMDGSIYAELMTGVPLDENGNPAVWVEFVEYLQECFDDEVWAKAWKQFNAIAPLVDADGELLPFEDVLTGYMADSSVNNGMYGVLFESGVSATFQCQNIMSGDYKWCLEWVLPDNRITMSDLRSTLLNFVVLIGASADMTYEKALETAATALSSRTASSSYVYGIDYVSGAAMLTVAKA